MMKDTIKTMERKPELLSPCGDRERLLSAVQYGADAVYLAGKNFGMRRLPLILGKRSCNGPFSTAISTE